MSDTQGVRSVVLDGLAAAMRRGSFGRWHAARLWGVREVERGAERVESPAVHSPG